MSDLLTLLLALRLYAQLEHVTAKGIAVFGDREYLQSLVEGYDHAYETLAERTLALQQPLDLYAVATDAAALLNTMKTGPTFAVLLEGESKLCGEVAAQMRGATPGTADLLGKIASRSEARQHRLRQRLS